MTLAELQPWIDAALAAGFTAAAPLDCKTITLKPEVRAMCAVNNCGKYGTNWSCPPGCGELSECTARINGYQNGIIVQTMGTLEDALDYEGMMAIAAQHAKAFQEFLPVLRKAFPEMLPIGTGACSRCESCTYPDAPCRFPEGAISPMEAYGMVVSDICQANGLPYYYGKNTLAYTGCYLLK